MGEIHFTLFRHPAMIRFPNNTLWFQPWFHVVLGGFRPATLRPLKPEASPLCMLFAFPKKPTGRVSFAEFLGTHPMLSVVSTL